MSRGTIRDGHHAAKTVRQAGKTPAEQLRELRTQREQLEAAYRERLVRMDQEISTLEARHRRLIRMAEQIETWNPEQLARKLQESQRQLALLRKALDTSR